MSASVEKMQADLVQRKQEFEGQVAEMQTAMRESTSKARALELGQLETTHHTALLTAERDNALQQVQHLQRQVSDDAEAVDEVRKKLQEREVEMVRAAGAAASETEELRAAYDARIGSATEEAVALRSQLAQLNTELSQAASERSESESAWRSKHETLEQECTRLQAALEVEEESAAKSSTTHASAMAALRGELEAALRAVAEKEAAGQSSAEEMARLRREVAERAESSARLSDELHSQLRAVSSELEASNARHAESNARHAETEASWKQKMSAFVVRHQALASELREAQSAVSSSQAELSATHSSEEAASQKEALAAMAAEAAIQEVTIVKTEMAENKEMAGATIGALESRLRESAAQLEAAKAERLQAEAAWEHKHDLSVEFRVRSVGDLQAALSDSQEAAARWEQKHAHAAQECARAAAATEAAVAQAAAVQRDLTESHNVALDGLTRRLENSKSALAHQRSLTEESEHQRAETGTSARQQTVALEKELEKARALLKDAQSDRLQSREVEAALRLELEKSSEAQDAAERRGTTAAAEQQRLQAVVHQLEAEQARSLAELSETSGTEMKDLRAAYDARIESATEEAVALRSQVAQLNAELSQTASEQSGSESAWRSKHETLEQECTRLRAEQSTLSSTHASAMAALRGELEAAQRAVAETEAAEQSSAEEMSRLRREAAERAESSSGVTALHSQLRTVSSELEQAKFAQSKNETTEAATLRAQLRTASSELEASKSELHQAQAASTLERKHDLETTDATNERLREQAEQLRVAHAAEIASLTSEADAARDVLQGQLERAEANSRSYEEQLSRRASEATQLAEELQQARAAASESSRVSEAARAAMEAELVAEKAKTLQQRESEKKRLQDLLLGVKKEKAAINAEWTEKHEAAISELNHKQQTLEIASEKRHADELDQLSRQISAMTDEVQTEQRARGHDKAVHLQENDLLRRQLELAAQGQQAAEKQWVELVSKSAEHKSMYVAARAQLEQQTQSTAVQRWKLGAEKAAQEAGAAARAEAESRLADATLSLQTSVEESTELQRRLADMSAHLDGAKADQAEAEAAWAHKVEAAEQARSSLERELEGSREMAARQARQAAAQAASEVASEHEAALGAVRELESSAERHEQERAALRQELEQATQAREETEKQMSTAVASAAEQKGLFLATQDALNKTLQEKQTLTEEQKQWQLGAQSAAAGIDGATTHSAVACQTEAVPDADSDEAGSPGSQLVRGRSTVPRSSSKQRSIEEQRARVEELQSRLDRQLALESTRAAMQEEELHALREKLEAAMAVAVTEAVSDVKAQLGKPTATLQRIAISVDLG